MSNPTRRILLVINPQRDQARKLALEIAAEFLKSGVEVASSDVSLIPGSLPFTNPKEVEVVIVLGGDGTILRAAELVRGENVPILGINMGNVGFLAEIITPTTKQIVEAVLSKKYHGEPRLVIAFEILRAGKSVHKGWSLNEVTIERSATQMVELFVQIDNRPLSRWGCDGVICATPTGSTAYAFSAGGPVLWPEVNAFVLLPLAAHALFSRPMVVSPDSEIVIDVESEVAEIASDGIRKFDLIAGDRVVLTRDSSQVHLSHIGEGVFTDRLVAKFKLPVEGWRGERA
ncbi:MAG: NAD kinase [Actinomycetes bacterium]